MMRCEKRLHWHVWNVGQISLRVIRCLPSAVGKIVSALAGNSASRSIRDSRVDDDYDVTAIGRLRCIVIRNALSATASELIRSIARSSSLNASGLVITSSTSPLKLGASGGHASAMMRGLPMVVSKLSTNHEEAPRENSETSSTINCCNGSRQNVCQPSKPHAFDLP